MKAAWSDEAKAHLTYIYNYIKRDSPFYATQTIDRLTRRVDQLIDHPRSGRVVPKYNDGRAGSGLAMKYVAYSEIAGTI